MELSMAALLAAAFAYRNIMSLVCVGFVAIGMASAPQTCARLWHILVCGCTGGLHRRVQAMSTKSYVCGSDKIYLSWQPAAASMPRLAVSVVSELCWSREDPSLDTWSPALQGIAWTVCSLHL